MPLVTVVLSSVIATVGEVVSKLCVNKVPALETLPAASVTVALRSMSSRPVKAAAFAAYTSTPLLVVTVNLSATCAVVKATASTVIITAAPAATLKP